MQVAAPTVDENQIWYEAVDGRPKHNVYGVGASTSSFNRGLDYAPPSSRPFSNLFPTMDDFNEAMRNAIRHEMADTRRRLIDFEDDRDELRLRFDWLTTKCRELGISFNPDDLPRVVRRNAPAPTAPPPAAVGSSGSAPAAASGSSSVAASGSSPAAASGSSPTAASGSSPAVAPRSVAPAGSAADLDTSHDADHTRLADD